MPMPARPGPSRCHHSKNVRVRGTASVSHTNDWSANPPNTAPLTTATPPTTSRSSVRQPAEHLEVGGAGRAQVHAERARRRSRRSRPRCANTASFVENRFTPRVAHAAGLSRMATSRRPNALRRSATTPRPTMQNSAVTKSRYAASARKSMPEERERLVEPEPEDLERRDALARVRRTPRVGRRSRTRPCARTPSSPARGTGPGAAAQGAPSAPRTAPRHAAATSRPHGLAVVEQIEPERPARPSSRTR